MLREEPDPVERSFRLCRPGRREPGAPGPARALPSLRTPPPSGSPRVAPARRAAPGMGCVLLALAFWLPTAGGAAGPAWAGGDCSCGKADLPVCVMPFFEPTGDSSPSQDLSPLLQAAVERKTGPLPWIAPRVSEVESTVVEPLLFRSSGRMDSRDPAPERWRDRGPEVYGQIGQERQTRYAVGLGAKYVVRVQVIEAGSGRTLSADVTRTASSETVFRAEKDAAGPDGLPAAVREIGEAVGGFFGEEAAFQCLQELERLIPAQLCTPASAVSRAQGLVGAYPQSLRLKILFLGLWVQVPDAAAGKQGAQVASGILPLLASDSGDSQRLLLERDLDPFLILAREQAAERNGPAVLATCRLGLDFWSIHRGDYRLLMVQALDQTGGKDEAASLCAQLRKETPPNDPLADAVARACAAR